MRLLRVLEDLVELGADELLPLDEGARDRVDRVLLLLDETLGLFIELAEHVVDEDENRRRVPGHRSWRDHQRRAHPEAGDVGQGSVRGLHEIGARACELRTEDELLDGA